MKSLLPPQAAKYYFDRHVILTISRSEIVKMTCLSKHNLDGDIFFLISLREIRKKMSPSKENFAAAGGKILFTQPLYIYPCTSHLLYSGVT